MNSTAIEFLIAHNIKIITLSDHCSHVLQPFDIVFVASFKAIIAIQNLPIFSLDFFGNTIQSLSSFRFIYIKFFDTSWSILYLMIAQSSYL